MQSVVQFWSHATRSIRTQGAWRHHHHTKEDQTFSSPPVSPSPLSENLDSNPGEIASNFFEHLQEMEPLEQVQSGFVQFKEEVYEWVAWAMSWCIVHVFILFRIFTAEVVSIAGRSRICLLNSKRVKAPRSASPNSSHNDLKWRAHLISLSIDKIYASHQ